MTSSTVSLTARHPATRFSEGIMNILSSLLNFFAHFLVLLGIVFSAVHGAWRDSRLFIPNSSTRHPYPRVLSLHYVLSANLAVYLLIASPHV
ncbi:hypothetical protein BKA66DRAFT_68687 [Pyrenochaeta sp. MPI-SDFR-AT-0127]|nr:hypothetical protein BKA66DRAFT_68687 [Pyrenochaeta sp. MPI-SDFR-AT-0127]